MLATRSSQFTRALVAIGGGIVLLAVLAIPAHAQKRVGARAEVSVTIIQVPVQSVSVDSAARQLEARSPVPEGRQQPEVSAYLAQGVRVVARPEAKVPDEASRVSRVVTLEYVAN